MRLTLPKTERLHHHAPVQVLYEQGKSHYAYPLRLIVHTLSPQQWAALFPAGRAPHTRPVQFMVTVPKKKFKKAVHRVRLRRRIREAYRLQRHQLLGPLPHDSRLLLGFIYVGDKEAPFSVIKEKMAKLLAIANPGQDEP